MKINAQCPICRKTLVSPLITPLPSISSRGYAIQAEDEKTPLLADPGASSSDAVQDNAELPWVGVIEFPLRSGFETVALGFHLHKPFHFERILPIIEDYRYRWSHPSPLTPTQLTTDIDFMITVPPSAQNSTPEQQISERMRQTLRLHLQNYVNVVTVIENVIHFRLEERQALTGLVQCLCMIATLPFSTVMCKNPYKCAGVMAHHCFGY